MNQNIGLTPPLDMLAHVDTPALVVDVAAALNNAALISTTCRSNNLRWRPHIKGIKTPHLLHLIEHAGARGFTCSKLGEAEALIDSGFDDILIANQIAGDVKIARLMALLQRGAEVTVSVDDLGNAAALGRAAAGAGVALAVVIEIDVGMKRAGVLPEDALSLARSITATAGLSLAGVVAWEGHAAQMADPVAKSEAVLAALAKLVAAADAIRQNGIPIAIVSCSGTGTYPIAAKVAGITEIQAGGGVLFDVAYQSLYRINHRFALFVLATVTSRPTPHRIICDAGRKSLSTDLAMPEPLGVGQVKSVRFSAEHGVIELEHPSVAPAIGERLLFVVGYGDMTVHLHDEMVAVRADEPVEIWPVSARGRSK